MLHRELNGIKLTILLQLCHQSQEEEKKPNKPNNSNNNPIQKEKRKQQPSTEREQTTETKHTNSSHIFHVIFFFHVDEHSCHDLVHYIRIYLLCVRTDVEILSLTECVM